MEQQPGTSNRKLLVEFGHHQSLLPQTRICGQVLSRRSLRIGCWPIIETIVLGSQSSSEILTKKISTSGGPERDASNPKSRCVIGSKRDCRPVYLAAAESLRRLT